MNRLGTVERRFGMRARSDFAARVLDGYRVRRARCVEFSPGGLLLDLGAVAAASARPAYLTIELKLDGLLQQIRAIGRPVWSLGSLQAVKLVRLSDADRLTLAERLDSASAADAAR